MGNFHGKFHQFARVPTNSMSRIKVKTSDSGQGYQDLSKLTTIRQTCRIPYSKWTVRDGQIGDKWWAKSEEEGVDVCRSGLEAGGWSVGWFQLTGTSSCRSRFARAGGASSRQCHVGPRQVHSYQHFSTHTNPEFSCQCESHKF